MILLALESATSVCSVAVCDAAGHVLGQRRGERAADQADRLVELIDAVLRDAGLEYAALEVIAVNTLEALAAALGPQPSGTIVAALDARRGQVYLQTFDHRLRALSAPHAVAPQDVTLAGAVPPLHLVGTGAALVRAVLPDDLATLSASAEPDALHVARRALSRLAAGERPVAGRAVQPLYLRAPDARLPISPRVRAPAAVEG